MGSDLFLAVDRRRVRASLEEALREAVRAGRLRPGTVLPSSRTLASDLGVARNTVVEVYGALTAEGWLSTRAGADTRVAHRGTPPQSATVTRPRVVDTYPVPERHDLRAGWPDLSSFPRRAWLRAAERALAGAPATAFGYQEPRGRPELRAALCEYLARARGVHADPEQVVLCAGITNGLYLLAHALRRRGATTWAVESHGLGVHRAGLTDLGLDLHLLEVDDEGVSWDPRTRPEADVLLVTPANQFPLGVTLSLARRRQIVMWAEDTDAFLVEDDYDGDVRYDRDPVGALQALAPHRVIYSGTVSKALAPGLRMGWLVVPPQLLEGVTTTKTLFRGHGSSLDELILAELLTSGDYERHLRRSRVRYRQRREQLVAALTQIDGVLVHGVQAGHHALVTLPKSVSEEAAIKAAHRYGLIVEGLHTFTATAAQRRPAALVIGYGGPSDRDYPECLRRLTAALRSSALRPS